MGELSSILYWVLLSSCFSIGHSQDDIPIVSTLSGDVQGTKGETTAGTSFFQFLAIPYAETPIGNLRFKDPVVISPWTGTLNGSVFSTGCTQVSEGALEGSEDCLYLNIWTPGISTKSLKAVMIWIHGGGFSSLDGKINPEFFMDEDVVIVSMNYRLGPFGFLAVEGSAELTGNIGLKDQQEAIQWVNRNIQYFGGDPDKVTLFGESAGAVSVHAHILSPRIGNLFQGAILQSGAALMMYTLYFNVNGAQNAQKVYLGRIGCDVADVMGCIKDMDVDKIMEIGSTDAVDAILFPFWLVQDSASLSPVLPENPLQVLMAGKMKKIPLIVGITKDDGGLAVMVDQRWRPAFESGETSDMAAPMGLIGSSEENINIATIFRRFYFSEGNFDENEQNIMEQSTDTYFGSPAAELSKFHSKVAPVFPFVLNQRCTDFSISALLEPRKMTGCSMVMICSAFSSHFQHSGLSQSLARRPAKPWSNPGQTLPSFKIPQVS